MTCPPAELPEYVPTLKVMYNNYLPGSESLAHACKCLAYITIFFFTPSKSLTGCGMSVFHRVDSQSDRLCNKKIDTSRFPPHPNSGPSCVTAGNFKVLSPGPSQTSPGRFVLKVAGSAALRSLDLPLAARRKPLAHRRDDGRVARDACAHLPAAGVVVGD